MPFQYVFSRAPKTLVAASVLAMAMAGGCASQSTPAPGAAELTGVDIAELAGKWEGEYSSTVTQRNGAISFDLNKATRSARGYILMTAYETETIRHKYGSKEPAATVTITEEKRTPLTIDFVAAKGGKVNGDVTPYFDPMFKTTVFTNFEGTLNGDRLEGTFTSRIGQTDNFYTGTWWAIRQ